MVEVWGVCLVVKNDESLLQGCLKVNKKYGKENQSTDKALSL